MAAESEQDELMCDAPGEQECVLDPLNREQLDWQTKHQAYCELPPCERRVLDLLVGRVEVKRIARELGVSRSTVRTQVDSLKRKLGATSIPDLVSIVTITLYEQARDAS
jgi:DNA-binding NarL/FixJ family response regulator